MSLADLAGLDPTIEVKDESSPLDAATVARLKAEYGDDLSVITIGKDVAVVRPPKRVEYKRFMDMTGDAKSPQRRAALEDLGKCCIVHPAGPELDVLIEKRAALLTKAAGLALEMAGIVEETEVKKL